MQEINARIGQRVRHRRTELAMSLDALAAQSGVSRSMLSLVERGESSPTAVVLDRIATGLGLPLAALFESTGRPAKPVSRGADRTSWRDPGTGYLRRAISPPGFPSSFQIVEVELPPGARVAYETGTRAAEIDQQIWVQEGSLELTQGASVHRLAADDCLAMRLDAPTTFHNRTRKPVRYIVVVGGGRAASAR